MKQIKQCKTIIGILTVIFLLCYGTGLHAQVTIGSGIKPNKGTLLDLKEWSPANPDTDNSTTSKGLGMPRVNLTALTVISDITGAEGKEIEHTGLMIYNVNRIDAADIFPGLYVWDGAIWRPLKTSTQVQNKNAQAQKNL
ncbi:hypothetical protein M2451_000868 [Dysgonomonas sp. PFB1-18]|uniref:hypothetical protein n=1 Tax=unclassified Dysgonomonas TaxID=2630389 RepID=UPI0024760A98|nr:MULTISPECIES: hypothetical protein [unclassified Dysgonomonas]MDH6308557.1 hypothetical protein [Dysgonomonas sp. PF1-14]MDH6338058.1 hypothetical protein [Dysgonomonas sp. PF1-16]MDH6379555.1 hypothetical protein [Dysgonomonas sp. PFB1-18]MDH6396885.1 hypothetical protein [Dysgonomonas sp. PF1-23]